MRGLTPIIIITPVKQKKLPAGNLFYFIGGGCGGLHLAQGLEALAVDAHY